LVTEEAFVIVDFWVLLLITCVIFGSEDELISLVKLTLLLLIKSNLLLLLLVLSWLLLFNIDVDLSLLLDVAVAVKCELTISFEKGVVRLELEFNELLIILFFVLIGYSL